MAKDLKDFLDACETLWTNLKNTKAFFPHMPPEAVGMRKVRTAPFYRNQGFDISFHFNRPLSEEDIAKNNEITHWQNQNFIIRLWSMIEYFKVVPKEKKNGIDKSLEGGLEVDLVRRLRTYFIHESGKYNPEDKEHKKTFESIRDNICDELVEPDTGVWIVPINKVLRPLYEGCIRYAKQKIMPV